jgi:hypothetical protein
MGKNLITGIVWAREGDVQPGDVLIADGGFTCLKNGQRCVVHLDEATAKTHKWPGSGLYVECKDGKHFIDGQLDDGVEYIGFTKA